MNKGLPRRDKAVPKRWKSSSTQGPEKSLLSFKNKMATLEHKLGSKVQADMVQWFPTLGGTILKRVIWK